jgi:multicomponent Na+:H+ antiporter subunit A
MIWFLLILHVVVFLALGVVGRSGRSFGRGVFVLAAIAPATAAIWVLTRLRGGTPQTASFVWVEGLGLDFSFRVDELSSLLTLIVSGIGVAVFVYSAGYFSAAATGMARFAATLLAFSTSMLGLVWANSVWTLFVFWELTSITSFLLIGNRHSDEATRLAARRALLITAVGGLVLMAGLILFTDVSGTSQLRDLPVMDGRKADLAAVLVLVAAATKSAQFPFHVWLPGAMAAPTPVSAYLHSATMVKAGVIVVAVLQPALGATGPWTPLGLAFGLTSMVWGAVGALRQVDAKLILAWGTVSQLGLMMALLAVDTAKATFAALSILVAHSVFKAALFMVVGEVDIRTGTRDIRELGGLRRSMPVAFGVALVSAGSMAGVPPLLGFAAKEAGIEAALGLSGLERVVVLGGVVGGSVLTVAYTVRLVVGVFGGSAADVVVAQPRAPITAITVALGMMSVLGFAALGSVTDIVRNAAVLVDSKAEVYSLLRWPGLTTAFLTSVAIVVAGASAGLVLARRAGPVPRPLGATTVDRFVMLTLHASRNVAGVVQNGSLPRYMLRFAVVAATATVPFVFAADLGALNGWDHPTQVALGAFVVAAAIGIVSVRNRLGAALGLGAVGFGVAGLFVVAGAPDLALTQLLVETVIVVGFVLGLGHLSREFPAFGGATRSVRVAVSALVAIGVTVGLAASASVPSGAPPIEELASEAAGTGGGNNVVNVILTDIRAMDTLGEIVVLVAVAIGVMSLARAGRGSAGEQSGAPNVRPGVTS